MTGELASGSRRLEGTPDEGLVEIGGSEFYLVPNLEMLDPFLMSIVSDGDRWMFVSSTGALTAGRGDASGALFPYETDNRLHGSSRTTGPVTSIQISRGTEEILWRPFELRSKGSIRRRLYKSVIGDSVIFEEEHGSAPVTFRYQWSSSDEFGFIRTASVVNEGEETLRVELLDGLMNILPHGLTPGLYQSMSNLTDAYKRNEIIDPATRLGVFSLESLIADRPEPAEVLKGTVVWSVGLANPQVTVSTDAIARFERKDVVPIHLTTGRPGAYLLHSKFELEPGAESSWHIVSDVAQDQKAVVSRRAMLRSDPNIESSLADAIDDSRESLKRIMARADAQQHTADEIATAHQFANVTYNVMRGGVPLSGYDIHTADFAAFVQARNTRIAERHNDWLWSLPGKIDRSRLEEQIDGLSDEHMSRLFLEYLPFSFSRRHGDPSRPWNRFSIHIRDSDGEPIIRYEGNWRDIFQNWEALCRSFPEYLPGVIAVFVNASTRDGFNPYRLTSEGIDWEVPDSDDPWSNIGYWGDHQIVYLLRLLEAADHYVPGAVERMLTRRLFTYADVPYRLRPYEELVVQPRSTIQFDENAAKLTADRVASLGADGKLVWRGDHLLMVNLAEKLLVPALAKLSSFVPGGGIWMNTQRPEWNDANNALVGYGISMVTLYHLRRYLRHMQKLVEALDQQSIEMSSEVAGWLSSVLAALRAMPDLRALDDVARKSTMNTLGEAFSAYRGSVYSNEFTGTSLVTKIDLIALCETAITRIEDTIRHSKRVDGLYHSYNLIRFSEDLSEAAVEHLHEMLEGQVAVLDSGFLSAVERADLLDALFDSSMYRADQASFTLYPVQQLPSFLDKNVIPTETLESNGLLSSLIAVGNDEIVSRDLEGNYRFHCSFTNASDLEAGLERLAENEAWADLVIAERSSVSQIYEKVFNHHAYTGRSGSMYAYEGIGSIYWHMVAKLLVAVQDSLVWAAETGAPEDDLQRLTESYWRVRSGLGFNKTAAEFGAIPLDPYSHTPLHAGAQQPGMTGLVKEEILTRLLELGVRVVDGQIVFDDLLLSPRELLSTHDSWDFYDRDLEPSNIELGAGSLGLTVCQTPVIVSTIAEEPHIEVLMEDGTTHHERGTAVPRHFSEMVFARSSEISEIRAHLPGT